MQIIKNSIQCLRVVMYLLMNKHVYNRKNSYDNYWKTRRNQFTGEMNTFQSYRAMWAEGKIISGSTVLDIGAGDGVILSYLMRKKSIKPIAADISDVSLNELSKRGIKTIRLKLDETDILKFPDVDHILLFEVLEHMPDPEMFIKNIKGKVKKSIIFSFPNTGYFPYRLRLLLGSFPMQYKNHPGEHVRFWTFKDAKKWLLDLGYKTNSSVDVYDGIPIVNRIFKNLFGMGIIGEIKITK